MEEEYREIEFRDTKLRVYRDGNIWRLCKVSNQFAKKGEWFNPTCKNNRGYFTTEIKGKSYLLHRIIGMVYLGLDIDDKSQQIDHINRIRTDNRVENIRIVNTQQNAFNRCNVKGYCKLPNGLYRSHIKKDQTLTILGYYETEEEAEKAYQDAKLIHHIII